MNTNVWSVTTLIFGVITELVSHKDSDWWPLLSDKCFRVLICHLICLHSLSAGSRWDTLVPLLPVRRHSSHSADQEQTLPTPHEQRAARLHLHSPITEVRNWECTRNASFKQSKRMCHLLYWLKKALPAYLCNAAEAFNSWSSSWSSFYPLTSYEQWEDSTQEVLF